MSEYEEKHVAYAARDILKGLEWLHSNGVVHRDLKSPNIMLDVEGVVKLSMFFIFSSYYFICYYYYSLLIFFFFLVDFGLAAYTDGEKDLIQMCGSPYWLSPEMIRMDPHSSPVCVFFFSFLFSIFKISLFFRLTFGALP